MIVLWWTIWINWFPMPVWINMQIQHQLRFVLISRVVGKVGVEESLIQYGWLKYIQPVTLK